jgi:HPt (histidine-containing phosphotransfer) domain-containing protein
VDAADDRAIDSAVLDELGESVGGDRSFVVELIETFLTESAGHVDAVEAAVATDDPPAVVRPAHTLKSSSATLGAMRLMAAARALEMAGRSGALDDAARRTAGSLRAEWDAATAALRAWMADG